MSTAAVERAPSFPAYLASPASLATRLSRTIDGQGNEGPPSWRPARHLRLLNSYLLALAGRKIDRLVVAMPPRHGKSELISYWLPIWWLALYPTERVILASYQTDLAIGWGRRVRNTIDDRQPLLTAECAIDPTDRAASRWSTVSGGGMISTGAGGAITGRGANLFVIDDPYKGREDADSQRQRAKVLTWYESTVRTRLAPNAVILIVQTRWHEDDLAGTMISRGWPTLRLPALADHHDHEGREIEEGEKDPLGREKGDALWSEQYDEEALSSVKHDVGDYVFSALYQGLPTPLEGGGLWSREQMDEAYRRYIEWGEPTEFDQISVGVDPHGGASEAGIIVAGMQKRDPRPRTTRPKRAVVLEDSSTDKKRWSQDAVDAYNRWEADKIVVEGNFGGEMVREVIEAIDPTIPVEIVHASRGKRVRAEPTAKLYEQYKIAHAQRFPELEDECCRFEPDMGMESPNRMDALVWVIHDFDLASKPKKARSYNTRKKAEDQEVRQGGLVLKGSQYVDKKP